MTRFIKGYKGVNKQGLAYEVLSDYKLTTIYAPDTSSCVERILKEKNEN